MKKIFDVFVELIFWFAIFASPLLISLAIATIIYFSNEKLLGLSIFISSIGFLTGIFIAEKIRRKQGCSNFFSTLFK